MKANLLLCVAAGIVGVSALASAADENGASTPVTKNPAAAGSGEAVGLAKRDGVTVSGNEAYVTRNGVTEKLVKDLQLPSGVLVRPDGTVVLANHAQSLLHADQVLTFEGKIVDVPLDPNVNPAPVAPVNSQTQASTGTSSIGASGQTAAIPQNGTGKPGVFLGSGGEPFMGTINSSGIITTTTGAVIPIDGSIRGVTFGPGGVPSVGRVNANGTITRADGTIVFRDGSIHNANGSLLTTAAQNQAARSMQSGQTSTNATSPQGATTQQGGPTQQGTTTQQGVTTQQGTSNQQGVTNQQGTTNQQGVTTQQGTTNQQGVTNQQGTTNQQGVTTQQGTTTNQPGNAASRLNGNTPATNGNAGGATTGGTGGTGGAPAAGGRR